jgi:hypothetical protein
MDSGKKKLMRTFLLKVLTKLLPDDNIRQRLPLGYTGGIPIIMGNNSGHESVIKLSYDDSDLTGVVDDRGRIYLNGHSCNSIAFCALVLEAIKYNRTIRTELKNLLRDEE